MAPPQDSKANEATVPVNVDELRKSKDLMLMRLMDLQSYVADLSKAYLEHANNVINGGPATIDIPPMHAGVGGLNLAVRAGSPGAKSEPGEKKRKRAPPDPNAPKRALTPYFLFMQHNRPKIAADLGPRAKPKDVADEGTQRWQNMSSLEKEIWKKLYAENYEKYKRDMEAYKAGKTVEEDHDPAASQLQNDIASADNAASDDDTSSDEDEDESEEESPAPKEPTPPPSSNKRRKSAAKEKVESPKKASPQKKGKATKEPAAEAKGGRKKRKSEGAK